MDSYKVCLAPMAGVTDWAFRTVCREVLPEIVTVSEMISAKALVFGDKKTQKLMKMEDRASKSAGVQIFGHEPDVMAEAARISVDRSGCDFVDINCGCPMPKIFGNGDGCALMADIPLAYQVIGSVVKAVDKPVTVKFRRGIDRGKLNAVEFAKMCESAGVYGVCVHGRTKVQGYSGEAVWDEVAEIKQKTQLFCAVSGDIGTAAAARRALIATGADGVMIGRAAFGNPFVLREAALGQSFEVTLADRLRCAGRQFELTVGDKGERVAVLEARHFLGWYLHGLPVRRRLSVDIVSMKNSEDFYKTLDMAKEMWYN